MALFNAFIVSSALLTRCAFSYPQTPSEKSASSITTPENGRPRMACESMDDCYSWALNECQVSQGSGQHIKAHCFNNYCYAACPPGTTTLQPEDHTDTVIKPMAIITKTMVHTVNVPHLSPLAAITQTRAPGNDHDKGEGEHWRQNLTWTSTTYPPPLDTTDAETETMTTITRSDGRIITAPIPHPLPTILPPDDDDDGGDYGRRRNTTALTITT